MHDVNALALLALALRPEAPRRPFPTAAFLIDFPHPRSYTVADLGLPRKAIASSRSGDWLLLAALRGGRRFPGSPGDFPRFSPPTSPAGGRRRRRRWSRRQAHEFQQLEIDPRPGVPYSPAIRKPVGPTKYILDILDILDISALYCIIALRDSLPSDH
jgi:hypothetical protein